MTLKQQQSAWWAVYLLDFSPAYSNWYYFTFIHVSQKYFGLPIQQFGISFISTPHFLLSVKNKSSWYSSMGIKHAHIRFYFLINYLVFSYFVQRFF